MTTVHALFVALDVVIAALSLRSMIVLRARAPWTTCGWAATVGYCIAAAVEYGGAAPHQAAAAISYVFLVVLTVAFVVAGVRDEPQAEPWWWPARTGLTRAGRRK